MPSRDGSDQLFPDDSQNSPLDPVALAYIAGLFDGEGSVAIDRHPPPPSYTLMVAITMTDGRAIELCKELFGGSITLSRRKKRWSSAKFWQIKAKRAFHFLKAIRPFLRVKGEAADIGIHFFEQYWRPGHQPVTEGRMRAGEGARNALAALHPKSAKLGRKQRKRQPSANPSLFTRASQPPLI